MKRRLFLLLALTLMSVGLSAQVLVFHLPDGAISTVQMPCTFTYSASGDKLIIDGSGTHVELQRDRILAMTYRPNRGDSNGDMTVDVADIATIISIMSGAEDGNDPEPGPGTGDDTNTGEAPAGVKAVDLGLPSGTKWANMNIGAQSPQEDGLYFAWGETKGYTSDTSDGRKFDWASYKWMAPDSTTWRGVNKYQVADGQTSGCWYQYDWDLVDYKFVGDGKSTLELADDAAAANWGGDWRMPTIDEFTELLNNTTHEWITIGGVSGRRFKSKKQNADGTYNSIFLPAAGNRDGASLNGQGTNGYYWSSAVYPSDSGSARYLYVNSGGASTYYYSRCYGRSVRAVLKN